jgi:FMN reductase
MRLVAVTAGLSQPSSTRLLTDRLVLGTEREATARNREIGTQIVELREHAQDLVSNLVTGFPPSRLRAVIEATMSADGVIAVTPVFNASFSGLFKLFFDVLERDSLAGVPVLVAATGGTKRHSLVLDHAMRPLFAYVGADVVPTGVFAAPEDWAGGTDDAEAGLAQRIQRAARELAAAMTARERRTLPDPFADPVPFEDLLGSPSNADDEAGARRSSV